MTLDIRPIQKGFMVLKIFLFTNNMFLYTLKSKIKELVIMTCILLQGYFYKVLSLKHHTNAKRVRHKINESQYFIDIFFSFESIIFKINSPFQALQIYFIDL